MITDAFNVIAGWAYILGFTVAIIAFAVWAGWCTVRTFGFNAPLIERALDILLGDCFPVLLAAQVAATIVLLILK